MTKSSRFILCSLYYCSLAAYHACLI